MFELITDIASFEFIERISEVRLRDDSIAFEDAKSAPAADLHNNAPGNSDPTQIAGRCAAQIVEKT